MGKERECEYLQMNSSRKGNKTLIGNRNIDESENEGERMGIKMKIIWDWEQQIRRV